MTDQTITVGLGAADIIGDKRHEILRLASQYKAHHVRIFGSVARGEARADSDIDFLVTFEPGYTLFDHAGLLVSLRDLLGRAVDVVHEPLLREEYRPYILRDAVSL